MVGAMMITPLGINKKEINNKGEPDRGFNSIKLDLIIKKGILYT